MGLLFQGSHHLFESLNLGSGNTSRDFPLKLQQMAADTVCKFATFRGRRDDKRAPIRFSDLTRNQVPLRQPIQNAGQCRSLMSKATMEFDHFRRPGMG
jgi:hypothetical protein